MEKITEWDIIRLNREIDFDELTDIFDWNIDHWKEVMKDMTIGQYKRFIALKIAYQSNNGSIENLIDFLDQFGIKRIKK